MTRPASGGRPCARRRATRGRDRWSPRSSPASSWWRTRTSESRSRRQALPVQVSETAATVRLRILLPENVPPGSVEVQLAGRKVVVLARTVHGKRLRSRSLRLSEEAVEDDAEADFAPDGSLTIVLQKKVRHGGP